MSDKNKVVVEGALQRAEAVAHLERLVAALKAGSVHIQQGADSACLTPPAIVDLKIEASQKADKEKLSLKLSWSSDPKYGVADDVSISAAEPTLTIG